MHHCVPFFNVVPVQVPVSSSPEVKYFKQDFVCEHVNRRDRSVTLACAAQDQYSPLGVRGGSEGLGRTAYIEFLAATLSA
jgi:hypothetical protein